MRSLQIILSILLFAIGGAGQSTKKTCSPNLLKAQIRGFSLGMTKAAVSKAMGGGIIWKTQTNGTEISTNTNFNDKRKFDGVRRIDFHVFEKVLYQISISYDDTVKMDSILTFRDDIAKSWKIKEKWKGEGFASVIECRERNVLVTINKDFSLSNSLMLERIAKKIKAAQTPFRP